MRKYSALNILTGWVVFIIAALTYLSTIEPTASFWDCGEFIAASYKLEVGHPPGAPFFLLIGRFFTLFAGNNKELVASMVNTMSALASAFTILFLFWTITHLVKKMMPSDNELQLSDSLIILASGVAGSLAYTFSDTFWFSAVEGEVYASSSLFTALVFWAILKWENIADEKFANRWLILIAYLMGLSIGVHLLNLLAIPAIVLIYYFRKYEVTKKGLFTAIAISILILGGIMYVLIPGFVGIAAIFERIFVNGFNLPYWSGGFFYLILLFSLIVYGIIYTYKKRYIVANSIILVITVILIGYSSYASIVIRSLANPPMDQNNPENLFNLLSYLNRDQYGDRPLLFGPYFNAPINESVEGKKIFAAIDGKYKVVSRKVKYKYDGNYQTIFPRMYSQQPEHINAYLKWTNLQESDFFEAHRDQKGEVSRDRYGDVVYDHKNPKKEPSFANNIKFLIKYQLGHMYFRYFMWNFAGRQNDIQGHFKEEINKGNWLSGFKFIDSKRLGNQNHLPDSVIKNRAFNRLYFLPLVLGLIGLFFHYKKDNKNFWVVMGLFLLTGIAIVFYLNQYPIQPRERDYAFAGSFYAFSIWIGISVIALFKAANQEGFKDLSKYAGKGLIAIVAIGIFNMSLNGNLGFIWSAFFILIFILTLLVIMRIIGSISKNQNIVGFAAILLTLPVPILMAKQNFDDHNRSGRYVARDLASNYLNSCEKNAILYTNGDNDTFPLWYAQEVEGIRTDVRVINMSYLSADWYIEQMGRRAYESAPVKMVLSEDKYRTGSRDIVYLFDRVKEPVDLSEAMKFVAQDAPEYKTVPGYQEKIDYLPSHTFKLKADSILVITNGTLKPDNLNKYTPEVEWTIQRNYIFKNSLMALDFLASNNWERPICYAITVSDDNYNNLQDYFELHGLAYQIVPAMLKNENSYLGGINTTAMYDNMMNKFRWGGIDNPKVYLDETIVRMVSNIRHNFQNLAQNLIIENKLDSALKVLDYCQKVLPNNRVSYDVYLIDMINSYYQLNKPEKAEELAKTIISNTCRDLDYIISLEKQYSDYLPYEKSLSVHIFREIVRIADSYGNKKFSAEIQHKFEKYAFVLQSGK
jgi:hypothetical protein